MRDVPSASGPKAWSPPRVVLAGVGMAPADVTARVREWLERAEVLAGGKRHLEWFADLPAEKIPLVSPMDESLRRIVAVSSERKTAVLASGDPLFFGIGRRLVERLGPERIITFPNVTAVQALFSRLGLPWDGVAVRSLHGRDDRSWLRVLRDTGKLALYTDAVRSPAAVARELLEAGMTDCDLAVGEDLGLPAERVRWMSAREASESDFSPLNVMAIIRCPEAAVRGVGAPEALEPVFGLPDEAFHHRYGLITKMEIRSVVLAKLGLIPGQVLWDLGAGSGSVAVEAARTVRLAGVFAVEKRTERVEDIRANVRRLALGDVTVICGDAVEAVAELPDPDRVFIGGSGGRLEALLAAAAARLRAGGRMVVTAATLETVETARSFFARRGFACDITQIQVNRSSPIGSATRFEPLNPVFIVTAASAASG